MKQRIITALIALVVLLIALLCYNTVVFNIFIALIGTMAVYELLHSTGYVKSKLITAFSCLYAFIVPFFEISGSKNFPIYITLIYFAFLFLTLLKYHQTIKFEEIAISFLVSLVIPLSFSMLILLRDYSEHGFFYTILICAAAWLTDSGAYFVGCAFGKHKLAPLISPKKTIEGAIGGLLTALIFFPLLAYLYQIILKNNGLIIEINYLNIIIVALITSVFGMIGDLLASVIKRQTGIKDYGTILPGHGGILDRFDSFLVVAPVFYILIKLLPLI